MTSRKDWLKKAAQARQGIEDDDNPASVEETATETNVTQKARTVATAKPKQPKKGRAMEEATKKAKTVKNPGSRGGKSADPAYTQVSAYVTHDVYDDVKIALIAEKRGRDFSDLVEELLAAWLKKQKA